MFDRQALHDIMDQAKFMAKSDDLTMQDATAAETGGTSYSYEKPGYSDQLPPFDITLTGANEFGQGTSMSINGVHLISEGTGMSIDDNIQESQMTFVAKSVSWWKPMTPNVPTEADNDNSSD